jgi:uncharacterized protein YicC (UPF0701 family)
MISSMTGFAAAAQESAQGSLGVELKTVNHRYLEFQVRIPEELRALEPADARGGGGEADARKVDCRVTYTPWVPQPAPSSPTPRPWPRSRRRAPR